VTWVAEGAFGQQWRRVTRRSCSHGKDLTLACIRSRISERVRSAFVASKTSLELTWRWRASAIGASGRVLQHARFRWSDTRLAHPVAVPARPVLL
jgi:hypothetical protein